MWYCMKDVTVTRLLVGVCMGSKRALLVSGQPETQRAVILEAFFFFSLDGSI